jgi:hypothetical protein
MNDLEWFLLKLEFRMAKERREAKKDHRNAKLFQELETIAGNMTRIAKIGDKE